MARTVQNIGNPASIEYAFINCAKTGFVQLGSNSPTLLNDDGYPVSTLTAGLGINFTLPAGSASVSWTLAWNGTLGDGTHGHSFSTGITVTRTVSGNVNSGGTGTGSTVFSGTDGRFEFTFTSMPTGSNSLVTQIQSGASFSNYRNLILCRTSDYNAIVNSGAIWRSEFLATLRTLGNGVTRFMGSVISSGNETNVLNSNWNYRVPLTAMTYKPQSGRQYIQNGWVGAGTLTGQSYSFGSYPDMPGSYTDGETFLGTVSGLLDAPYTVTAVASSSGKIKLTLSSTVVATISTGDVICYSGYGAAGSLTIGKGFWSVTVLNSTDIELTTNYQTGLASAFGAAATSNGTVTTGTINVGSRGKVPLLRCGTFPNPSGGGGINATGLVAFVYSGLLKSVIATSGPLYAGLPVELSVDLCNTLGVDYWYNQGFWATPAYAQGAITYVRDHLSPGLNCVFEVSNENWNTAFAQFAWGELCGIALNLNSGVSNSNQINAWSYQGLHVALMADAIRPIWNATRAPSQLKVTTSNWAQSGTISTFDTYALQGNLLDATSNTALSAYTGGKSYNIGSPTFNRPVDKLSLISIAPYAFVPKSTGAALYTIAQQWATGSKTTALASLDAQMKAITDSYVGANNLYDKCNTLCTNYDSQRPAGMPNLEIWCYEGGFEWEFPLVADYVTNTMSTSATVTFNVGSSPSVNWTAHGLQNGCRVSFSGGTLPTISGGSIGGADWYVCNVSANAFDLCSENVAPSLLTPATLGGSPSGTTTATASQYSFDNAVEGWLKSNNSLQMVQYYLKQFAGYPRWVKGAFLTLEGWQATHRTWSLFPGDLDTQNYQVYDGVRLFNNGKRRMVW